MLRSLVYVGVTSPASETWAKDGPEIYGFELVERGPDGAVRLRLDDSPYRIAIHPGDTDGLSYLGWDVGGPAELEAALLRLEAVGLELHRSTPALIAERCVGDLAWFLDPLGFRHELVWGQHTMPSTFRPGRGISGFVTGDKGLGHVVLIAPDLSYERFLMDVLGFKLTDQLTGHTNVRFYHINPRHHSLGFAVVPNTVGFHHLMVQVSDINDVGIAYDIALKRGVPMAQSLGHHGNDRTTSFYARSPSGFELEYGYGGREIDDATWVIATYDRTSIWGHHVPANGRIPTGTARPYKSEE